MSKSIMIVGAGPGIGQAVAERFGREGWSVVLAGRRQDRLDAIVSSLRAKHIDAHAVAADATDPAALREAITRSECLTGGLSIVHFNAAVVRAQDLFSMSDADVDSDLAINVAAGLHTIRAAVAQFGDRGGSILVTGGGLAVTPHEGYASLGVGKAALRNIVQALAGPLKAKGIRLSLLAVATLVAPGSPETSDVADLFWTIAADPNAPWETFYPAPTGSITA